MDPIRRNILTTGATAAATAAVRHDFDIFCLVVNRFPNANPPNDRRVPTL